MTFRKKQLDAEARKVLERNLLDRMTAAHRHMADIIKEYKVQKASDLPASVEKKYKHLYRRFEELQISYRLVHNTNWLMDIRTSELEKINELLLDESKLHNIQVANYKRMKAAFEKQLKCTKCNLTGIVGENVSTGEFKLCQCVTNHLDIYKHL